MDYRPHLRGFGLQSGARPAGDAPDREEPERLMRATRVRAARTDKRDSEVVEEALSTSASTS